MDQVTIVDHPLAGHLLAGLRDVRTGPDPFRTLSDRLAAVLVLAATRELETRADTVQTPIGPATVRLLDRPVVAVPVLRAGLGLLAAATGLLPDVRTGFIGMQRDEDTLAPGVYYAHVPPLADAQVLLLDPMLATGGSAAAAAALLKGAGGVALTLVSVVAAPEGIRRMTAQHPDVRIVTAAVDERLNDAGFIVPGLGDYGDRLFGTRDDAAGQTERSLYRP